MSLIKSTSPLLKVEKTKFFETFRDTIENLKVISRPKILYLEFYLGKFVNNIKRFKTLD